MKPEEYLRPEVIRQVQRFDLKAKFLMEGFLSGLHSSPFKGFSVEFSEHRKYVPGDDIRTVDWKVWSRTNRYYVKQYEAETNLTCNILVDISASMGYAGKKGALTKLEYATYCAGALAYLMIHQQDPVGLITFDDEIRTVLKPKSRTSHLISVLKCLHETRPSGPTRVGPMLHTIAEMIDHRGLVILLSDLLDDPEEILKAFWHLRYRGHDVIVFHILDATEVTFPYDHLSRFMDPEGADIVIADPPAVRAAYLEEIKNWIGHLEAECTRQRVDYVQVDTSTSFDKALLAYLVRRTGA